MNELVLIIGMMAVTFLPRYLPIALAGRFRIPAVLQKALEFIPIAVLTAIISQASLIHDNKIDFAVDNPYLYALLASISIALLTKDMFKTIVSGLLVYATAFALI